MQLAVLQKIAKGKYISGALWICLISVFFMSPAVKAAFIVVNTSVPKTPYTLADTRAVFMMHQRFWPNGERIKVFVLADSDPLHKDFVKTNLKMYPHQLRRVWDRMSFSGTGIAPTLLYSEQEMIDKIANTPNSIGYIHNRAAHENIRFFEYQ